MTRVGVVTGAGRGMGATCAARMIDMVDALLLIDRDEASVRDAAQAFGATGGATHIEPMGIDITDRDGLQRLATRISELGTLRAVAHAAAVSPTMAEWRSILAVDLVGSAMLLETLAPLATDGTAIVCFASIAPYLAPDGPPAAEAALDDPLDPGFVDRLHEALGSEIEDSGMAYAWAKRGVHRLVRREAVRFGASGARICSVSPGIIDTPMARQEADARDTNAILVQHTPLAREGQPEEVAGTVAFLLSDDASFVSGIDVPVDGGVLAALRGGGLPA